jgi:hypothetical protein
MTTIFDIFRLTEDRRRFATLLLIVFASLC